jgi:hypothetical protein
MGVDTITDALKGNLDEVRLSNIARSADWINFEYHNMGDAGHAVTWGAAE